MIKPLLPKQHGAWAMLLVPFWLGVAASDFRFGHVPLFIGWFFLYLASYAGLMLAKGKQRKKYAGWTAIYFGLAALCLATPVLEEPRLIWFGVSLIPLFAISMYYSVQNKDRALANDISAILVFSLAGAASYFYGVHRVDALAGFIVLVSFLFFLGSTFYVKTMIREKTSLLYRNVSWSYHSILVLLWVLLGEWWIGLAFVPSLFRAIVFYGRKLSILKVGVYEIGNAVAFFVITLIAVL
ncbi:YwiC-like family protein [Aneurinibacillus sp. REN35]|uniref:YwiC-like family protein n=1 Tax=Aneurinibacillus sp. REN35 TaxID=3237286 RepID=UPI0035294C87